MRSVRRTAPLVVVWAMIALGSTLLPHAARAQDEGFAMDRYRPAPGPDDPFGLQLPSTPGPWRPSGKLVIDYAHAPLVLSETNAAGERTELGTLVEHALTAHAIFSLGIGDRGSVWLGLPVMLVRSGEDPNDARFTATAPDGAAVGDLAIGTSIRAVGGEAPPSDDFDVQLGFAAELLVPSGSQDELAGDGGVGVDGRILLALASAGLTPILNLGVRYRPKRTYVTAQTGTELTFGVGATLPASDDIGLEAELRGATTFSDFFGDAATPLELLLGARFALGDEVYLGAGLGAGITGGVGVPDFRALASFGWASAGGAETAGEDVDDADDDGIPDDEDACPEEAGPGDGCPTEGAGPTDDRDSDGVPDGDDFCPDQAETQNSFQDEDGCPDGVERTDSHLRVTPSLLFDAESAELTPDAELLLELVAQALHDATDIEMVQIEGHASTDEGAGRRVLRLSEQRAEAVVHWLVDHGIEDSRLTAVGIGTDQPADAEEPAENRRVELRIVNF